MPKSSDAVPGSAMRSLACSRLRRLTPEAFRDCEARLRWNRAASVEGTVRITKSAVAATTPGARKNSAYYGYGMRTTPRLIAQAAPAS